ncbi:hypothetical protein ACFLXX_05325, partial [Chloroflexota bacterium]
SSMENEEIIGSRLSVLESRIAAVEQQLFVLVRGGTMTKRKPRRELTPEEKKAVRERLVAGQENARLKREAEAKKEK